MNYGPQPSQNRINRSGARVSPNSRSAARPAGARPAQNNAARRPAVRKTAPKESTISIVKTNIKPILAVEQERVRTVKAKARKPFPLSAVVMVTICTLLLMFLVISYVQINEYTIEVASLRGELADLVEERKELTLSLEEKNDMVAIEEYASELGMVKADQLAKKHITLEQEDKVEVVETEPVEDVTVVSGVMSAIAENFSGLWEYIDR